MRRNGYSVVIVVSLLAGRASLRADEGPTPVKTARQAAKKDASTPEGREWEHRHAAWMGPTLTPIMQQCAQQAPGVSQEFSAYVHLSKVGKALEAVAEPSNPFTLCITKRLKDVEYPEVPRERYWLEIEMHIRQ
jgi:hypothetical protein